MPSQSAPGFLNLRAFFFARARRKPGVGAPRNKSRPARVRLARTNSGAKIRGELRSALRAHAPRFTQTAQACKLKARVPAGFGISCTNPASIPRKPKKREGFQICPPYCKSKLPPSKGAPFTHVQRRLRSSARPAASTPNTAAYADGSGTAKPMSSAVIEPRNQSSIP